MRNTVFNFSLARHENTDTDTHSQQAHYHAQSAQNENTDPDTHIQNAQYNESSARLENTDADTQKSTSAKLCKFSVTWEYRYRHP